MFSTFRSQLAFLAFLAFWPTLWKVLKQRGCKCPLGWNPSLSHSPSLSFSLSLLANKNLETKECSYHYRPATQSVNSAYNPNKLMRKMKNKLVNLCFSLLASFFLIFFCFLVLLCADSKCWNCWNFTSYYQLFYCSIIAFFFAFTWTAEWKFLKQGWRRPHVVRNS